MWAVWEGGHLVQRYVRLSKAFERDYSSSEPETLFFWCLSVREEACRARKVVDGSLTSFLAYQCWAVAHDFLSGEEA